MTIRDLGDGLVLRHATAADTDALVAFNADVHRDYGAPEPDAGVAGWTRDLVERPHPTFTIADFTIVEETRTGRIVSSLNLISQTWTYDGVPFGVGRPELVGTHPDYRRRGLVRLQFEEIHRWSAARGELVQAITGIRWYYRQFGYEYALDLDGRRIVYRSQVPKLAEGTEEPYRLRPATADDLPFVAAVDERARARYLVSCVRNAALWRYELDGLSPANPGRRQWRIVEDTRGTAVGFLIHESALRRQLLNVRALELAEGVPWPAVMPSILRYLAATGETYASEPGATGFESLAFVLETDHPAYGAAPSILARAIPPYAWYIRVPDLPRFLNHIGPVLERRLDQSDAAGYTGELRLNFFRDGVQLAFREGRLATVAPWPEAHYDTAQASFPDLTFLKLLFGYRSLDELRDAFPDCSVRHDEAEAVLSALFPKRPSFVWPVE